MLSPASATPFAPPAASHMSPSGRGIQLVVQAVAWLAERRRVRRTMAALSNLSDHTLADIGIERHDIARVARYGRGPLR